MKLSIYNNRRGAYNTLIIFTFYLIFSNQAIAQDSRTYSDSYSAPVFDQVDQNGVDLITGSLRFTSPTYVFSPEQEPRIFGLQWTGRGWIHLDRPTISRDGRTYIVNYLGSSQEFNDRRSNYLEKKPITGSKLTCSVFEPSGITAECVYTHRNGDIVNFQGIPTPFTPTSPNYGISTLSNGNIGMVRVEQHSDVNRIRFWGRPFIGSGENNSGGKRVNIGPMFLETPNNDSSSHYLIPRNTIQVFTDTLGSQWRYTVNNSRLITKIDAPGNTADINITYRDDRVSSVTNANGVWAYTYSSTINNFRTTTVTNPRGEVTRVRSNIDKGYVVEHTDPLNRVTKYQYDTGYRVIQITYPELNHTVYKYDARGNIVLKEDYPKPGSTLYPIRESAEFPETCANAVTCNLPISLTNSLSQKTEFHYYTPVQRNIEFARRPYYFDFGSTKPNIVTFSAPEVGAPRPQIRNDYSQRGVLIRSAYCRTQVSCVGTADEVVTTFDYSLPQNFEVTFDLDGNLSVVPYIWGMSVTADGETLTTCYGYDETGRRVNTTPPRANVATCPKILAPIAPVVPAAVAEPSPAPAQADPVPDPINFEI